VKNIAKCSSFTTSLHQPPPRPLEEKKHFLHTGTAQRKAEYYQFVRRYSLIELTLHVRWQLAGKVAFNRKPFLSESGIGVFVEWQKDRELHPFLQSRIDITRTLFFHVLQLQVHINEWLRPLKTYFQQLSSQYRSQSKPAFSQPSQLKFRFFSVSSRKPLPSMLTSSHYSLMFSITFYDLRRSICSHLNFVKSLLREEVVRCPRPYFPPFSSCRFCHSEISSHLLVPR